MKIRFLGCGHSAGIPSIQGDWGNCNPANPKNQRSRSSLALEWEGQTWIIDMSPDLKQQCLRESIGQIHGVLCTHAHFDHIAGLGDLRPLAWALPEKSLPIYADQETLAHLFKAFSYAMYALPGQETKEYQPFLKPHVIYGPFKAHGQTFIPFVQDHGYTHSLGFRFGNVAYSTDVVRFSEEAFQTLENLDLWIVDCLDLVPKPSHAHLDLVLSWVERLQPRKVILTHMGPQIDYDVLRTCLPDHIILAYDGLFLDMNVDWERAWRF
jgi:phosphoribosyl 1,2-cyclic phosphate phosphodiesterase